MKITAHPTGKELVTGYSTTVGRLWITLTTVPISHTVISMFLDSLQSKWLASNLQQMLKWHKLSPPHYRCVTQISSVLEYKPQWQGGTNG